MSEMCPRNPNERPPSITSGASKFLAWHASIDRRMNEPMPPLTPTARQRTEGLLGDNEEVGMMKLTLNLSRLTPDESQQRALYLYVCGVPDEVLENVFEVDVGVAAELMAEWRLGFSQPVGFEQKKDENDSTELSVVLEDDGETADRQFTSEAKLNAPVRAYLGKISMTELLSADRELELFALVKAGQLSKDDPRATNEAEAAREKILEAYLKLVVAVAKRYDDDTMRMDFIDLVQEGSMGILRAIEKFDTSQGIRFGGYAKYWVRAEIVKAKNHQSRTIRLPKHILDVTYRIGQANEKLKKEFGRSPTIDEVANEVDMAVEELEQVKSYDRSPLSLEAPTKSDGSQRLLDLLAEKAVSGSVEDQMIQTTLQQSVSDLMQILDDKQRHITELFFGFQGMPMNYTQIGKLYNVEGSTIKYHLDRALRAMRRDERTVALRYYLED